MQNTQNKVTLAYIDLGRDSMRTEESKLRVMIDHNTFPDNDQIMAYPYPFNYGVDRRISLQVCIYTEDNEQKIRYSLTFVHSCLLWQHTRSYDLTCDEYETCLARINAKYGSNNASFVNDYTDIWGDFEFVHCLYWNIDKFNL